MTVCAVIGLGTMGAPIAGHLAAAGLAPQLWNRTPPDPALVPPGARLVALADVDADIVLAALPDVPQLRTVLQDGLRGALAGRRALLVVMSTSSPADILALADELASDRIRVIDAPMSGGDAGARAGRLSLMVGGAVDDVESARPVFATFATTILHFGAVGAGSTAKLCNQVVVGSTLAALAEAVALGSASGLDPALLLDAFAGGLADSAVLRLKRDKLLHREYSLGGSLDNQVKDLRYAEELARRAGVPAEVLAASLRRYEAARASGLGALDHAVVLESILRS